MKALILLTLFLPLASPAAPAAPATIIPDCWTVDGESIGLNKDRQEIADGHFIIVVDTKKSTMESLLTTMQKANSANLQPLGYPIIFPYQLFISTKTVDYNVPHLERNALKQAVFQQLTELLKAEGVTVECEEIAHPASGR